MDSAAAVGIAKRQGVGKARRLSVKTLWLQQLQKEKDIEVRKQPGEENGADLGTKILDRPRLIKCMGLLNMKGEILNDAVSAVARGEHKRDGSGARIRMPVAKDIAQLIALRAAMLVRQTDGGRRGGPPFDGIR